MARASDSRNPASKQRRRKRRRDELMKTRKLFRPTRAIGYPLGNPGGLESRARPASLLMLIANEHTFYWWRVRLGLSRKPLVKRPQRRQLTKPLTFAEVVVNVIQ